ncbi:MAG TPA: Kae1-associated serine/threonine protein kinase [Nanoarchaeota archaeon]|nr:Kae1-associated serine/threonine protein kinase [Nanoarchaeota archaeon]HIH63692.1 Kae1-associated serine/threonine protein kinase [Nanoarchaeota archaeon]HIJ09200.1 Kae1-associated serine/threonine protein kinase [Nanoarchaeota archaeon]
MKQKINISSGITEGSTRCHRSELRGSLKETNGCLSQGAEAKIVLQENKIIKKRIKKSYRIPQLDEKIRKLRTRSETKLLEKASKIINAPKIIKSNENTKEIEMEFINGKRLSEELNKLSLQKQKEISKKIGENISKIHDEHIIHGDLTTSNMILLKDKLFFIDFGLGYISQKYEDKAVDLHLLKQALIAKHYKNAEILFNEILKSYTKSKDSKLVLEQLKKVEKRGRYKN